MSARASSIVGTRCTPRARAGVSARALAGAAVMAPLLAGCAREAWRPGAGRGGGDGAHLGASAGVANAFAPVAMRIHPLTHLDVGRGDAGRVDAGGTGGAGGPGGVDGQPRVVLHVELSDRWADPTKGLGVLRVFLFEPEAGPLGVTPGIERQAMEWTLDLTDPDQAALWYDRATRTYRVPLVDVPAWVAAAARREGERRPVRLRATFTALGPDGLERVMRDEYVVPG